MEVSYNVDPNQIIARLASTLIPEGVAVIVDTDDAHCAVSGLNPASGVLGVSRTSTPAGQSCDIVQGGIARMKAGAAITRGNWITSDATGRGIPATLAAAGATYIELVGQAIESTDAADTFFACKVLLTPAIIA